MMMEGQAGFDCKNCGYGEAVHTREDEKLLMNELTWKDANPICPECKHMVLFESDLDD